MILVKNWIGQEWDQIQWIGSVLILWGSLIRFLSNLMRPELCRELSLWIRYHCTNCSACLGCIIWPCDSHPGAGIPEQEVCLIQGGNSKSVNSALERGWLQSCTKPSWLMTAVQLSLLVEERYMAAAEANVQRLLVPGEPEDTQCLPRCVAASPGSRFISARSTMWPGQTELTVLYCRTFVLRLFVFAGKIAIISHLMPINKKFLPMYRIKILPRSIMNFEFL